MTEIFYWIGGTVDPMLEILPQLGNAPNAMIIGAGTLIFAACIKYLMDMQAIEDGE